MPNVRLIYCTQCMIDSAYPNQATAPIFFKGLANIYFCFYEACLSKYHIFRYLNFKKIFFKHAGINRIMKKCKINVNRCSPITE